MDKQMEMEGKEFIWIKLRKSTTVWSSARQDPTLQVQMVKRTVSLIQSACHSAGQGTRGLVKAFLTNHSHTPAYTWSTRRINPKIIRRRSYSLQSSSPTNQAAPPPCKIPEIHKIYTIRTSFQRGSQISHHLILIPRGFSRSKQNISEI